MFMTDKKKKKKAKQAGNVYVRVREIDITVC